MAVTGAIWCDFIVYTSKGIYRYVQHILFDPVFWAGLKQKLLSYMYYFEHFIKFASAKLSDGSKQKLIVLTSLCFKQISCFQIHEVLIVAILL